MFKNVVKYNNKIINEIKHLNIKMHLKSNNITCNNNNKYRITLHATCNLTIFCMYFTYLC